MLVVVMIFFGVGKLPEVGKSLGRSLREFKSAQRAGAIEQGQTESEESTAASVEVGASL
jgi:sec-independent protein translocase protein TatA